MKTYVVVIDFEISDAASIDSLADQLGAEVQAHGGRYLVQGGAARALGGDLDAERITVIEFDNPEQPQALVESQTFSELRRRRNQSTKASAFVVEGA